MATEEAISKRHSPYPLAARSVHPGGSRVQVGPVTFGGQEFILTAGPCAVESERQLAEAARMAAHAGARMLRGGAYKPRTSPYSFQGLGEEGLVLLAAQGAALGMPVVTEVMSVEELPQVARYADMLQVGARNMQNYPLLKALGGAGKPVLLKRGLSATIEEWLLAAEYILSAGNSQVVLCERGIRTFETATRNTLDLNALALVKRLTHLPVVVDPSHGTGRRELVVPMSAAALAAGADGLMVEVHPEPHKALSDGDQSLDEVSLHSLARTLAALTPAVGRTLGKAPSKLDMRGHMAVYRQRIDSLDAGLVRLLAERARVGALLGEQKAAAGLPMRDPVREQEVLERVSSHEAGVLNSDALQRIFKQIMQETLDVEERLRA
jgi:3-deoxy-7-phosphoheptulonate synthase